MLPVATLSIAPRVPPTKKSSEEEPVAAAKYSTRGFELMIAGMEVANAFSELNDPEDQRERFLAQIKAKEDGNEDLNDF